MSLEKRKTILQGKILMMLLTNLFKPVMHGFQATKFKSIFLHISFFSENSQIQQSVNISLSNSEALSEIQTHKEFW